MAAPDIEISTGAYVFPKDRAARIAWKETRAHGAALERIRFVCFGTGDADIYERARTAF